MKPEVSTCLEEIRTAIVEIETYIKLDAGHQAYLAHRPSQLIAERLLTVIGEAVKRIERLDGTVAITNALQIYGMRNRLAHDYNNVDHAMVYVVLTRHIPVLRSEVEALLRQHG